MLVYNGLCDELRSTCMCLYQQVMEEVVKLLAPINMTKLEAYAEGTDISPWMQAGVPGELNYYVYLSASLQLAVNVDDRVIECVNTDNITI